MRRVEALEAWKCFGAQSALLVGPNDLLDSQKLTDYGRKVGAIVRVQPDNDEVIFLQREGKNTARQRALKLHELDTITFWDL